MRPRRTIAAGLAAVTATLAACGGGSSPSSSSSTGGDSVIGVITVTSGPAADIASVSTRGSNLAVRDANAKGGVLGRQVRIELCDNGSPQRVADPPTTIAC